jgi:hypothetical protein
LGLADDGCLAQGAAAKDTTDMIVKKARKSTPHETARRNPPKAQRSKAKTRHKHAPRALEMQLRKTVAELGLTEARKIFASVEAAFED